jgi:hypothetical protein
MKTEMDLMETALGIGPNIFLVLPSDKPTLVHHVSKVPRNLLLTNNADEFFCLLGWEQSAMAIKLDPSSFFAATCKGEENIVESTFRI